MNGRCSSIPKWTRCREGSRCIKYANRLGGQRSISSPGTCTGKQQETPAGESKHSSHCRQPDQCSDFLVSLLCSGMHRLDTDFRRVGDLILIVHESSSMDGVKYGERRKCGELLTDVSRNFFWSFEVEMMRCRSRITIHFLFTNSEN